ncbi:MAG: aspartate--tRNA ligase [Candidatus Aminicenantes bacterium]|nr:aspartate--tRNA ligase [Candidatus Aminicenantes bacterium]
MNIKNNLFTWKRTHYAGTLRRENIGQRVTVCGWVQRLRDLGQLVFLDLRDREGLIQIVFSHESPDLLSLAKQLRVESVIGVKGIVRPRGEGATNPQLPTGEIEIAAEELVVFNEARIPPFQVIDPVVASEELRFRYRYLDLRRPSMQRNLRLRHEAALKTRFYFHRHGFLEIETPFLTKSTPEGARDYLVPSRLHKGKFYALPQSPQLFKQTLMIAGLDRYFQIVRCFRDEDLRADRQPEFTQIDVEMSFADEEDIFTLIEGLMVELFDLIGEKITPPFPRLSYQECLEKYGTDKPDLRNKITLLDFTSFLERASTEFLKLAQQANYVLKGIVIPGGASLSRSQLEKIQQQVKSKGSKGLIWIKGEGELKSSPRLEPGDALALWEKAGATAKDLLLLCLDQRDLVLKILGDLRGELAPSSSSPSFAFAWIKDFPLFEWREEEKKIVSVHHPFTSPHPDDLDLLEREPLKVRARAYDLVLNGYEIGGGSVRIHDMNLQRKIFQLLNLKEKEIEEKFGFFLEALTYGTPPHAGIALGFDRLIMLLAGQNSIREVIPFPKTTSALCLLTGSPSSVSPAQLDELGIEIKKTDKKNHNF